MRYDSEHEQFMTVAPVKESNSSTQARPITNDLDMATSDSRAQERLMTIGGETVMSYP